MNCEHFKKRTTSAKLLRILALLLVASSSTALEPSSQPSSRPSLLPTRLSTVAPSSAPSESPIDSPSKSPSSEPSKSPVKAQSSLPSTVPSKGPSSEPSKAPVKAPSNLPSNVPSKGPTSQPSKSPVKTPSASPSNLPSAVQSPQPSSPVSPSVSPSILPTSAPTSQPSKAPVGAPSISPSNLPSDVTSKGPTSQPSKSPVKTPSVSPSSLSTDVPTKGPTKQPSKSPVMAPSTSSPTQYDCTGKADRTDRFYIEGKSTSCTWVGRQSTTTRCTITNVADSCPVTCGLCPGSPTPAPIVTKTPSMNPSKMPSMNPTKSPVKVTSTFKLVLSPVTGEKMKDEEKAYFEEKAKAWIEPLLNGTVPKIELTDLKIVGQNVGSIRRRLVDDTAVLTVDIEINGKVQPTGSITQPSDVGFDDKVEGFFANGEHRAVLMDNLKTGDSANADYFDSVTSLNLPANKNQIKTGDDITNDSTETQNNSIVVIAASAAGGAVVLFAAALYAYTRKRRRPHDLQLIEEEVVNDMENLFPDINTGPKKEETETREWAPVQPQMPLQPLRPTGQQAGTDDDATDGGRSQRTFNTLEKIYSGEQDNNSFQSYGYSLEDGVVSTNLASLVSASIADASAPMKMDLFALNSSRYNFTEDEDTVNVSVGVPRESDEASSIYSGLTMDDEKTPKVAAEQEYIRDCLAPAGKLGIVIDTTSRGPVVHQVKAGSPLEDSIFVGDRIIAIDDVDTRNLSASAVTKIMARKCNEPRTLKVLSKQTK